MEKKEIIEGLSIHNIIVDKKNKTKDVFGRIVKRYIDSNHQCLYCNTPLYRLYFSDKPDRDIIFKLFQVNKNDVQNMMKKLESTNNNWKILNDPFNILMTIIIREATISKDKMFLNNALLYLTFSLYASLHFKFYPYPPNKEVMEYTINNVSNKFLFKQYGIVLKAIAHTAIANHEKYGKSLLRGNDEDVLFYLMFLRTRLNNQMKAFANEYHDNYKNGKVIFNQSDSYDDEDYRETENISMSVVKITESVAINFFSVKPDMRFVKMAAKLSQSDPSVLYNSILNMKENQTKNVRELIRHILIVYLSDPENSVESVGSNKFLNYSVTLYSKSNTKNDSILKIKSILDELLLENCRRYSTTNREATKGNYRKGLFIYFVILIQQNQIKK